MFPSEPKKMLFYGHFRDVFAKLCTDNYGFLTFYFLFLNLIYLFYFQVFKQKSQKKNEYLNRMKIWFQFFVKTNKKKDSKIRLAWHVWSFMSVTDLVKVVESISFLFARRRKTQRKGLGFLVSINFDTLVHIFGYLKRIGLRKTHV